MFKCIGSSISEVGPNKTPMYTLTLMPTDGDQVQARALRIVGPAGSIAASIVYGKTYTIAEAEEPTA